MSTKRLLRKKQRVYNKAKQSKKQNHWIEFHNLRKTCQKRSNQDYFKYINGLIDPAEDTTKKNLWSYIKSKRNESFGVAPLKSNGQIHIRPEAKAEALNAQFCSVFTKENVDHIPDKGPSPHPSMPKISISTNGIEKQLKHLNPKKASGPDGITCRFLKDYAKELSPILSYIYQQSLDSSQVPKDWRNAQVVPLFKKEDRSKPVNYRPVSLTAVCCKVLEHVIVSNMMTHLDKHNILTDYQHGFRRSRSCETQLFLTVNDLAFALHKAQQVDMAVLDFSKAFDKVPHRRLVKKLDFYGIRGGTNQWIANFLHGRLQRVVVDGSVSSEERVVSGVPQGSVLGPVLFLVYINDTVDGIGSNIRLFADDCILYRTIKTPEDHQALQHDLNTLHKWSVDWQMAFNVKKCFSLSVTKKRKHKSQFTYSMGGENMASTSSTTYLGVTINKSLDWSEHIDSITKKANRILGLLRRNLQKAPREVKTAAYKALVRPRLEYCASVWSPHQENQKNKLEMVQRRAARFVLNKPHRLTDPAADSVSDMLKQLEWESLALKTKSWSK